MYEENEGFVWLFSFSGVKVFFFLDLNVKQYKMEMISENKDLLGSISCEGMCFLMLCCVICGWMMKLVDDELMNLMRMMVKKKVYDEDDDEKEDCWWWRLR